MTGSPLSGGEKPPDWSQKNHLPVVNQPQQTSSQTNNTVDTDLQSKIGITVANFRLGTTENFSIISEPNRVIPTAVNQSSSPIRPPHQISDHSTAGIVSSDHLNRPDLHQLIGNNDQLGQLIQNQCQSTPQAQEIISHPLLPISIAPNYTTLQKEILTESRTPDVRPNAEVRIETQLVCQSTPSPSQNPNKVSRQAKLRELWKNSEGLTSTDATVSEQTAGMLQLLPVMDNSKSKGPAAVVTMTSPQPPSILTSSQTLDYSRILRPSNYAANLSKIELLPVKFDNGEPMIQFTMEEVNNFTREEGLHQAVVLKFSYGKPDMQEIRKNLSSQFNVQGHCNVGQLDFRHVLVRFDLYDDYVKFLSKSTGYFKFKGDEFFFRTFPWTLGFNPKEETSMAIVWISLPGLPPNFFAKRSLMSIASVVGKALSVDKATQDRTRPSAARVKVILDLLEKRPKRVKLQIIDKLTGKYVVYYQEVVYDNLPKYCTCCKHQGHDENMCRFLKEQSGEEKEVTNGTLSVEEGRNLGKLQGDARDYLNAKRAGQTLVKTTATKVMEGQQQFVKNAKTQQAGEVRIDTAVTGTVAIQQSGSGLQIGEELTHNKGSSKSSRDVPDSTVFDRMKLATAGVVRNDSDRTSGSAQVEKKETIDRATKLVEEQQHKIAGQTSDKQVAAQMLGNENASQMGLSSENIGGKVVEVDKSDDTTKNKRGWKVVTGRISNAKLGDSTEQQREGVRSNGTSKAANANVFEPLAYIEGDQLVSTVQMEAMMSKQIVPCYRYGKEAKARELFDLEKDTRRQVLKTNRLEEVTNIPSLHFSSPHIKQIIKDAQTRIMMHNNMVKQPLVSLNTSVQEIPSQSLESCGEHGGEFMFTSGNNKRGYEGDDYDDEDDGKSSEEADYQSEDEGGLSIGSPSFPNDNSIAISSNIVKPKFQLLKPQTENSTTTAVKIAAQNSSTQQQQLKINNSAVEGKIAAAQIASAQQHISENLPVVQPGQQQIHTSRALRANAVTSIKSGQQQHQSSTGNPMKGQQQQHQSPSSLVQSKEVTTTNHDVSNHDVPKATVRNTYSSEEGHQQQQNGSSSSGINAAVAVKAGQMQEQMQYQNNSTNALTARQQRKQKEANTRDALIKEIAAAEARQIQLNLRTSCQGSPVRRGEEHQQQQHMRNKSSQISLEDRRLLHADQVSQEVNEMENVTNAEDQQQINTSRQQHSTDRDRKGIAEENIRHLPMRAAKLKQVVATTSTKSNRSKK